MCATVACPGVARADDSPASAPSPSAAPSTNTPAPPASTAPSPGAEAPANSTQTPPIPKLQLRGGRPSPLQVDYAQYGLAIGGDFDLSSGPICPEKATTPCILGSGGGLTLRGGYRPAGPWYFGAAYQFSKLDSNNLFRLGIFQQLRYDMRYYLDLGARITPYIEWGGGGCIYGNLWGASTGGALLRAGTGFQLEITRFVLVGLMLAYQPTLLAGYTDSTGQERKTGISHFLHFEVVLELRTELGRE